MRGLIRHCVSGISDVDTNLLGAVEAEIIFLGGICVKLVFCLIIFFSLLINFFIFICFILNTGLVGVV